MIFNDVVSLTYLFVIILFAKAEDNYNSLSETPYHRCKINTTSKTLNCSDLDNFQQQLCIDPKLSISFPVHELIFNRNKLTTINYPYCWKFFPQLKLLRIHQQNDLTYIHPNAFNGLKELETLDLQQNNLQLFTEASISDIKNLKRLKLDKNPLACNCSVLWIWEVLHSNQTGKTWLKNNRTSLECYSLETRSFVSIYSLAKERLCEFKVIRVIPNAEVFEVVKLDPWKIKEIENAVKNEVHKSIRNVIILIMIPMGLPLILYVWIYRSVCIDCCVHRKSNKPGKSKIEKKEEDGFIHPNGIFIPTRPKTSFEIRPTIQPDVDDLYALNGGESDDLLKDEHLYINLSNLDCDAICAEENFKTKVQTFIYSMISPFIHIKELITHLIQNCYEYKKCRDMKTSCNVVSGGSIIFNDTRPVPPRRFEYLTVQPESAYIELDDIRQMYGVLNQGNHSQPATCDLLVEGNYMDLAECHYEVPTRQNDYDIELDYMTSEEMYTTLH